MLDARQFLQRTVFYPRSGIGCAPVKFLSTRFPCFFYADASVSRERFEEDLQRPCFHGYRCQSIQDLPFESVFGRTADALMTQIGNSWDAPFVTLARFLRLAGFAESHGAEQFDLLFARCDPVTAFRETFSRFRLAPRCVVHLRSGASPADVPPPEFLRQLGQALQECPGGLPRFLLYDDDAGDRSSPDHLDIVECYDTVERWDYRPGGRGKGQATLGILNRAKADPGGRGGARGKAHSAARLVK